MTDRLWTDTTDLHTHKWMDVQDDRQDKESKRERKNGQKDTSNH